MQPEFKRKLSLAYQVFENNNEALIYRTYIANLYQEDIWIASKNTFTTKQHFLICVKEVWNDTIQSSRAPGQPIARWPINPVLWAFRIPLATFTPKSCTLTYDPCYVGTWNMNLSGSMSPVAVIGS